ERPAAALTWRIAELAKSAINRDRDAADERRWRHWAEQVNPTLTGTPQWPAIRGLLRSLQRQGTDTGNLIPHLQDRSVGDIRAALMRLSATKNRPRVIGGLSASRIRHTTGPSHHRLGPSI